MKTFGALCFFIGVVALALMTIRRGRKVPVDRTDHIMMFVGLAGIIAGMTIVFSRI